MPTVPEIKHNPEPIREGDFRYPPFSFTFFPELETVHELALSRGEPNLNNLNWLTSLTRPGSEPKTLIKDQFLFLSDNSPLSSAEPRPQLEKTHALHIYAAAKLEHLLRLQALTTPVGTNNGIGKLVAENLAKLSNTYRNRFSESQQDIHLLKLAHDLSMYALRFKEPDFHGPSQSLSHWLHLQYHGTDRITQEELIENEERLKLCLSLAEMGEDPSSTYSHILVRDLVTTFERLGKKDDRDLLESHYVNIPTQKTRVEVLTNHAMDNARKERVVAQQQTAQNYRKNKRRRNKR